MTGFLCAIPVIASLFNSCVEVPPFASGYVEGEYVMIAPVASARIAVLDVQRGDRVKTDQLLVTMEERDANIALEKAEANLEKAEASLANLQEGARPEEIAAIEASLVSAKAQSDEAQRTIERQNSLLKTGATTQARVDDADTAAKIALAKVAEIEAKLAVAKLPARPHEIEAAEASLEEVQAAREQAEWNLDQRKLRAPSDGRIYDVIRTVGELGGPAAPVLSMLPDGAVKLRLYVPENVVSKLQIGSELDVRCDGCPDGLTAAVAYISDSPEFTPPVIYSLENRQTLVFMIEAIPGREAQRLMPGQIVDVNLLELGG